MPGASETTTRMKHGGCLGATACLKASLAMACDAGQVPQGALPACPKETPAQVTACAGKVGDRSMSGGRIAAAWLVGKAAP